MSFSVMLSQLAKGMTVTTEIFFVTLVFSLPLGLLVCWGKMSKIPVIRWIMTAYISIMRGTPLMLQLMVVLFRPVLSFSESAFPCAYQPDCRAHCLCHQLRRILCGNIPRRHRVHVRWASTRRLKCLGIFQGHRPSSCIILPQVIQANPAVRHQRGDHAWSRTPPLPS